MNCTPKVLCLTFGVHMYGRHNFEERLNLISRLIAGVYPEAICSEETLDKYPAHQ